MFIQKIGFPHIINLGIYEITKDPSRPNILPGTLLSDSDATDVKARLSQHPDDRKHPRGNCSIPGTNPLWKNRPWWPIRTDFDHDHLWFAENLKAIRQPQKSPFQTPIPKKGAYFQYRYTVGKSVHPYYKPNNAIHKSGYLRRIDRLIRGKQVHTKNNRHGVESDGTPTER